MRKKTITNILVLSITAILIVLTLTTFAYANSTPVGLSNLDTGAFDQDAYPYPVPYCKNNIPYLGPSQSAPSGTYPDPVECGYLPSIFNFTVWFDNLFGEQ